jgi:hypothetical protein
MAKKNEGERFSFGGDGPTVSQCVGCARKYAGAEGCEAFPDVIPDAILLNEFDHDHPFPGDNGLQFKAKENAE